MLKTNIFKHLPIDTIRVTSPFGERIHPVDKVPQFHSGVDLRASNVNVHAVAEGTVIISSVHVNLGNYVVIEHPGFVTISQHLRIRNVAQGAKVIAGQVIGVAGNTGKSSGPHLHFELREGKYLAKGFWKSTPEGNPGATDPMPMIEYMLDPNKDALEGIDAAVKKKYITSPSYWKKLLEGTVEFKPEYFKAFLENISKK